VHTSCSWGVIILAYNEEASLRPVAEHTSRVLEEITPRFSILIVDDGSADGTGRIADELSRQDARIRVIHHERNKGIGHGLLTGYTHAEGDIVGMIPADGQFDPEDLRLLCPYLDDYDIIATYRMQRNDSLFRMFITSVNRILVSLLFGVSIRDVNWVKFYKRRILHSVRIQSVSPMVESEIVIQAVRNGGRMIEIPSSYYPRMAGKARGASFRHLSRSILDLVKLYKRLR
jgi:glycosyltransferase involved in cell wall biosynthesis